MLMTCPHGKLTEENLPAFGVYGLEASNAMYNRQCHFGALSMQLGEETLYGLKKHFEKGKSSSIKKCKKRWQHVRYMPTFLILEHLQSTPYFS